MTFDNKDMNILMIIEFWASGQNKKFIHFFYIFKYVNNKYVKDFLTL